MSSYAFTNMQNMLYGTYIFLANTEKADISAEFCNGKADNIAL